MTWLAPGGGVDLKVYQTVTKLSNQFNFSLGIGKTIEHNQFADVDIMIHQCPYLLRPISIANDLRAVYWFYKLFKRERPHIVHTHEAKASVVTRLAAWLAGVPLIIFGLEGVTFNDPMHPLKRQFYILLERLTIWTNDFIIAVGQDTIDAYHHQGLGVHIPYQIIYDGIDTQQFISPEPAVISSRVRAQLGIGLDQKLLVNVGRFTSSKNQKALLEIMPSIIARYPQAMLLFIGQGDELQYCIDMAKSLGISEHIRFLGHCNNVPELLMASDLFVFTSKREGLPRVLVEAGMCKLPVVTYDVEGAKEIIKSDDYGFVIPPGDQNRMIEKITYLLTNPEEANRIGQNLFSFVCEQWALDRMLQNQASLYKELYQKKINK